MIEKWPSFETKDLDLESDEGSAELDRRWEIYNREMQDLIASGAVHQDEDGWWVDNATGALIGEDPEDVRPLTDEELARMRPFKEVFPDLYASIQRTKAGRPPLGDKTKQQISLRLDPDVIAKFRATGKGWQSRINAVLRKAKV